MDFKLIKEIYENNQIADDELVYFEILIKLDMWKNKSDLEKLNYKIEQLAMYNIHFTENIDLKLEKFGVEFLKESFKFLTQIGNNIVYDELNNQQGVLFRIKNLLLYEKLMLNMYPKIISTRGHIFPSVMEKLILKLDEAVRAEYFLDRLLVLYKSMMNEFYLIHPSLKQ